MAAESMPHLLDVAQVPQTAHNLERSGGVKPCRDLILGTTRFCQSNAAPLSIQFCICALLTVCHPSLPGNGNA